MSKVSVVILNYNKWHLVHQLLMDIYQKCSLPLIREVLVVNNGCTEDASFTGLNWWMSTKMLPIRELRLEENLGFIGGFNAGLKEAKGEVVIAISNDVRIRADIVDWSSKNVNDDILAGARLIDWNSGWNTFDGRTFSYLEGWLLITTWDAWEDLGWFDTLFCPNDMEDIDLSTKAVDLGMVLSVLPDGMATHLGAGTYGYTPEREAITIRNKEKFKQKWVTKVNP